MSYSKIEDFLKDSSFRNWVRNPNSKSKSFWESWIQNHPDMTSDVLKAKEIILSIGIAHSDSITPTKEEFNKVFENIIKGKHSQTSDYGNYREMKRRYFWYKLAASFLLISLVGLSILKLTIDKPAQVDSNQLVVRENHKGRKSTIRLKDGSVIHLNVNSKLIYPSTFSKERREVSLVGEAFFEVSKDSKRPFIVATGELRTKVIGTSFNIRVDSITNQVKVALLSGKVIVENSQKSLSVELHPLEMATFDKSREEIFINVFSYDQEIGWKDGILVFVDADFNQIVHKLENWFDVDIKVNQEVVLERKFNGKFVSKSLEYILEALAFTSNLEFEINDGVVIINNK